jgi:hypothetical protein
MRTKTAVLAALTTSALLAAPVTLAQQAEPVKSTSADLNGDGKPEVISLQWEEGQPQFVLKVGNATARGDAKDTEVHGVSIIDIDGSDKRKEVAVHAGMTDDDQRTFVYAFDGKALKALGSVPALTEVKGNSIILSDSWQGFWNKRDKFVLDAKAGKLSEVPQELYFVGAEATVKQSFPLARSRTDKSPLAQLAQGSKIQVLAAWPPGRAGGLYLYLVKSSTGLLGWATVTDLMEKTEGLPLAG